MSNANKDRIWIDVIEDIPELGCHTTTIPLYEPLRAGETMREWLESHGYCDIVDFRIVVGPWVMPWTSPALEWVWIQTMTRPHTSQPPSWN